MLEELELRDDGGAVHLTELEHRRPADPAGDPLGGGADVLGADGHGPHPTTARDAHRLTGL